MSARRVLAIARRILQQFRRDPRTLAMLFVVPLVILGAFYYLLRGGGQAPAMGVVDLDRGPLGAAITSRLVGSSLVRATPMAPATAEAQLRDATIAGYVVFAPGFSADLQHAHLLAPDVHLEGSQPGPAQAVQAAVAQATAAGLADAVTALLPRGVQLPRVAPAVSYLHGGPSLDTLDYFGAAFIGLIVFFLVFVITSVSFLRERSQGTLERLFASSLRRGEIVVGYMLGFSLVALVQGAVVLVFSLGVLRLHNSGSALLIFAIEALMVVMAVNLGIFLSMFARTEFQAVQFIPVVVLPQVLLSGILLPVASEPRWMQALSDLLPLTYAVDALRDVMLKGADLSWATVRWDAAVVLGYGVALILLAAATLRRRIA
jgi:ABC-2 type transport system permease protein